MSALIPSSVVPNLRQRLVILRTDPTVLAVCHIPSSRHSKRLFIKIRSRVDRFALPREVLMVDDLSPHLVGSCLVHLLIVHIPPWVLHVELSHGQILMNIPATSRAHGDHLARVVTVRVHGLCELLLLLSLTLLYLLGGRQLHGCCSHSHWFMVEDWGYVLVGLNGRRERVLAVVLARHGAGDTADVEKHHCVCVCVVCVW